MPKPARPRRAEAERRLAKAQPYKGSPASKADHAAFKRADKAVSKPMRIKY